jgi:hypothetical protein
MLTASYAECHIKAPCAEGRYAQCCYAECRGASGRVLATRSRVRFPVPLAQ